LSSSSVGDGELERRPVCERDAPTGSVEDDAVLFNGTQGYLVEWLEVPGEFLQRCVLDGPARGHLIADDDGEVSVAGCNAVAVRE
jgi:hypothetical protein